MTALIVILILSSPGDIYQEIEVTRNPDPFWVPQTYEEWIVGEPDFEPLQIDEMIGGDGDVNILILLDEDLSDSVPLSLLDQWVTDMASQGLTAEVLECTYSTPEELKDYFISRLPDGLEGAVLLGDLPAAWCALDEPSWQTQEQFPTDYFYMDLDGVWEDLWVGYPSEANPGQDGMYDTWSGELAPEIYIGRIRPSALSAIADPADIIVAYLQRNHEWRLSGDPEPLNALCYVDDDWADWGLEFQNSMQFLYANVELVNDYAETNGTDYRYNRLPGNYVWISPFVHSNPVCHSWAPGPLTYWSDIVPAAPPSRFYNLFACSNSRFTTDKNMGSIYALATSSGLASIGTTKTGSMLMFSPFYQPLGDGASIGEGFAEWWDYIALGGLSQDEKQWHLGMALIGDPTLIPVPNTVDVDGSAPFPVVVPAFDLSPNPAGSMVMLSAAGLEGQPASIRVFDTSGRLVNENIMPASGVFMLDLTGLEAGIYLVRMVSSTGVSVVRSLVRIP